MNQGGNTAHYADAVVELFKTASLLEIWDKKREADILTAVMHNDLEKFASLNVKKGELVYLHSEVKAALRDANSPEGVVDAMNQIFSTPLSSLGVKMSRKKLAAKKLERPDTTVDMLKAKVEQRPQEYTRVTETGKVKVKVPVPVVRNLDYAEQIPKSETSTEYFEKLKMTSMPPEEKPKTGYEGLNELYTRRPNEDPNSKRFKQTQQGHKQDGVLITPCYMNNGIMYRGDMVHMILEDIAKRTTTGLSVYVGAVPLHKEDLNNIGDAAMRLVMKDNDMVAKKLSGIVFTALLTKVAELGDDTRLELKKEAYNNNAFESQGMVSRDVIYPVRPVSNILQYAHQDKMISIDRRSLSGVLMRADVKNQILQRLSVQKPIGKTSTDLKVYYVRLIEAGAIGKASKFKKACKELYDVDCGELDDKVLDVAHDGSVMLDEVSNALFPTQKHQQELDLSAATSNPTGAESDAPVKLSYVDIQSLMEKYVTAKRVGTSSGLVADGDTPVLELLSKYAANRLEVVSRTKKAPRWPRSFRVG